jgi:hypothetical protein
MKCNIQPTTLVIAFLAAIVLTGLGGAADRGRRLFQNADAFGRIDEALDISDERFGPLRPATDPMATSYSAVLLWADAVREPMAVVKPSRFSPVISPLSE